MTTSQTQISLPASPIRESWTVLPRWIQPLLTQLSGKPYLGEPVRNRTPTGHLLSAVLVLATGLTLSAMGPLLGGTTWLALPVGYLLTVHAARKLQVLILHQASHLTFAPTRTWLNRLVGEAISIGLQIQAFETYRREHIRDHHSKNHMSEHDPTVAFLFKELGLRPGMPRRESWRRTIRCLLSPWFHVRLLVQRLASNFGRQAAGHHRVLSTVYGLAVLAVVAYSGQWRMFLTAVVVPLTLLYNIASTLRLCTEHRFPAPALTDRYSREALASFTSAIFLGDPAPDPAWPLSRRLAVWTWWFMRVLFLHLPGRLLIVPGDTTCHDLHHRRPALTEWANYLFERQREVENPRPGEWPPYSETWGSVFTAIDEVFLSLERADPKEYPSCLSAA